MVVSSFTFPCAGRLLSRTSGDATSAVLCCSATSERAWFPRGMVILLELVKILTELYGLEYPEKKENPCFTCLALGSWSVKVA